MSINKIIRVIVDSDGNTVNELVRDRLPEPPPLPPLPPVVTEEIAVHEFVTAANDSDRQRLERSFVLLEQVQCWRSAVRNALTVAQSSASMRKALLGIWIERGLRLRQLIGDDGLLLDMFRACGSPYAGPGLHLYRGDSSGNVTSRNFGFAWTSSLEWARMHALRFATKDAPGVVLKAWVTTKAIITNPDSHMPEEQEYIVIPAELADIEVIDTVFAV
jgi:hypothetical protein